MSRSSVRNGAGREAPSGAVALAMSWDSDTAIVGQMHTLCQSR